MRKPILLKLAVLLAFAGILTSIATLAYAFPAIPFRVYGTASIGNASAPDGTLVEAKIDGITAASTTTQNGAYGMGPDIFYITDPDGTRANKTITFFINGADTGKKTVFKSGGSQELKLNTAQSPAAGPQDSGTSAASCTPAWSCTEWSECVNSRQGRTCADMNNCGGTRGMPELTRECAGIPPGELLNSTDDGSGQTQMQENNNQSAQDYTPTGLYSALTSRSAAVIIILVIIAAIILYGYSRK